VRPLVPAALVALVLGSAPDAGSRDGEPGATRPVELPSASATAERSAGGERVTFNKDIAPIVFANCAACHRPGEAGPFSLLTYANVRSRARQIAAVTQERYMPPWPPEPGKAVFSGERRLSDAQIALIQKWVETGGAEGEPEDLPEAPRFTVGWQLGEPDLVLSAPAPFPLRAAGTDVFHNLVFEAPVATTRYVRAVEIRLDDRKVAHHANLLVDRTRASRRRDAADPEVGFAGMDLAMESVGFDPDSHFLFWKPGTVPSEEPAGMAWRLDRGTDLVLNLHLRPSGKPELVRPTIGLYFTDQAPTRFPMLLQLEHDGALDIPPGDRDFVVTDELTLPVDVDVLAIYPHAHYLGKDVQGLATLPDGTKTWLIHIADWDVNWQAVYRYARPLFLPRGTTITMRWSYDNSEDNVRNPSRPPRRVTTGNRAEDEMGHLWLQVLPHGGEATGGAGDPRIALQEASMRRRIAKYPGDFTAHYNLGAAYQAEGRLDDAVGEIRRALAIDPDAATAHTSLAAALQAQGRPEALVEFEQAVRLRPGDASARLNLGQALVAQGRLADALDHCRAAVRLDPEDSGAQAELGAVLLQTGSATEAIVHFREALRIDPDHVNARYNLGQALAGQGEWAAAAAAFREATDRRPQDADAQDGLGLALLALGQTDEAIGAFRQALRTKPDDLTAHDALGQALFSHGAVDEAVQHFRELAKGRPDDPDVCNNLGSALAAQGHLAEAAAQFERALALDPSHAAARANLAQARAALPKP
jgi:tetratricopeptide (TPR) repeat protein/mono/diheme cytochrome c family protein